MAPADIQPLVMDLVADQAKAINPEVRDRAIGEACVRYSADFAEAETIPPQHRMPVAQYAAYLLCQQLATRYSGERDTAVGGDVARTESRARNYAARAKEFRAAYYEGTGQADPFASATSGGGNGLAAAAAVTSWPGRRRNQLTRGVV